MLFLENVYQFYKIDKRFASDKLQQCHQQVQSLTVIARYKEIQVSLIVDIFICYCFENPKSKKGYKTFFKTVI